MVVPKPRRQKSSIALAMLAYVIVVLWACAVVLVQMLGISEHSHSQAESSVDEVGGWVIDSQTDQARSAGHQEHAFVIDVTEGNFPQDKSVQGINSLSREASPATTNSAGNSDVVGIESLETFSETINMAFGYMLHHAQILREESRRLELSLEEDLSESKRRSTLKAVRQLPGATTTRLSHPLHLVLYASPPTTKSNNTRIMVNLLRLQAERSNFFETITVLGPNDVPDDFRREFSTILPSNTATDEVLWARRLLSVDFGLWRYPLWEKVMHEIPLYDTILFLDSSNTAGIYATGRDMLDKWAQRVVEASERRNEPRREFLRFPQDPRKNGDLKWTSDAVFDAFGLKIQGDNSWWQATKAQYYGGLMLVRNGAQWRNLTSLIYETLAKDPYIITDRYTEATKKRRPTRFGGHMYDQSISSIATKILDNHIQSPLMARWVNPPFRLQSSNSHHVTNEQVQEWSTACKPDTAVTRDMDNFCDSYFDSVTPRI